MKFGVAFIGLVIAEVFLYLFGYIESNSLIAILLGTGNWTSFLSLDGLLTTTNLILSITSIVGIVTKNQYMIFGSLTLFLLDTVFGLSGIIGIFPAPFGYILFGIISLVFTWLGLEWWRQNES